VIGAIIVLAGGGTPSPAKGRCGRAPPCTQLEYQPICHGRECGPPSGTVPVSKNLAAAHLSDSAIGITWAARSHAVATTPGRDNRRKAKQRRLYTKAGQASSRPAPDRRHGTGCGLIGSPGLDATTPSSGAPGALADVQGDGSVLVHQSCAMLPGRGQSCCKVIADGKADKEQYGAGRMRLYETCFLQNR